MSQIDAVVPEEERVEAEKVEAAV